MNGKPQVMVVDDDLSMCNFLRSFLAERGYQANSRIITTTDQVIQEALNLKR